VARISVARTDFCNLIRVFMLIAPGPGSICYQDF
jgi:hypothetical protein